jgi:hypothetical protein
MSHVILMLLAALMATVVMVRAVCVIYKAYYKTHPRGNLHFALFGYSYVAFGVAAATALAYLITNDPAYSRPAVWLFLAASAGMILFDRRPRR